MPNLYNIIKSSSDEILGARFDLGIFASGFDGRASYLAKQVNPQNITHPLVIGFREFTNNETRVKNDDFYTTHYKKPIILAASRDKEIFEALNSIFTKFPDNKDLKVLLDYTSMSRLWYSGILNYFKLQNNRQIEVYLNYCPGNYAGEIHDYGYNSIHALPSHEGSLSSNLRTLLIIPTGFYPDIVKSVINKIEPNEIVGILAIPSIKKEYECYCLKAKKELEIDILKWLNCPVDDMEAIFRAYADIINNNPNKEIIFLPLGPKIFNMASILISQRFDNVTCLYLETRVNPENSVDATGDCICTKVIYQ
jgi:hypothetical protein